MPNHTENLMLSKENKIYMHIKDFSNWLTFGNVPAPTLENQRSFVSSAHCAAANCGSLHYIGRLRAFSWTVT